MQNLEVLLLLAVAPAIPTLGLLYIAKRERDDRQRRHLVKQISEYIRFLHWWKEYLRILLNINDKNQVSAWAMKEKHELDTNNPEDPLGYLIDPLNNYPIDTAMHDPLVNDSLSQLYVELGVGILEVNKNLDYTIRAFKSMAIRTPGNLGSEHALEYIRKSSSRIKTLGDGLTVYCVNFEVKCIQTACIIDAHIHKSEQYRRRYGIKDLVKARLGRLERYRNNLMRYKMDLDMQKSKTRAALVKHRKERDKKVDAVFRQ